jgi:hypothetical protein
MIGWMIQIVSALCLSSVMHIKTDESFKIYPIAYCMYFIFVAVQTTLEMILVHIFVKRLKLIHNWVKPLILLAFASFVSKLFMFACCILTFRLYFKNDTL